MSRKKVEPDFSDLNFLVYPINIIVDKWVSIPKERRNELKRLANKVSETNCWYRTFFAAKIIKMLP